MDKKSLEEEKIVENATTTSIAFKIVKSAHFEMAGVGVTLVSFLSSPFVLSIIFFSLFF